MRETFEPVETQCQRAGFIGGRRLIDEQSLQTESVKERGRAIDDIPEWHVFGVKNALYVRRAHLAREKPAASAGIQSAEDRIGIHLPRHSRIFLSD